MKLKYIRVKVSFTKARGTYPLINVSGTKIFLMLSLKNIWESLYEIILAGLNE
jgi:hypothetical protein